MKANCYFQPREMVANLPRRRARRKRLRLHANSERVPPSAQTACRIARQPSENFLPACIYVLFF